MNQPNYKYTFNINLGPLTQPQDWETIHAPNYEEALKQLRAKRRPGLWTLRDTDDHSPAALRAVALSAAADAQARRPRAKKKAWLAVLAVIAVIAVAAIALAAVVGAEDGAMHANAQPTPSPTHIHGQKA